eukprot:1529670-Amphidinium_carterae.1
MLEGVSRDDDVYSDAEEKRSLKGKFGVMFSLFLLQSTATRQCWNRAIEQPKPCRHPLSPPTGVKSIIVTQLQSPKALQVDR